MATTQTRKQDAASNAERLVDTVTEASAQAGERLTEMAGSASEVVRDAERGLRRSSDQTLGIIGGMALGFAAGLFVSGAHRLLVIASLVPFALVAAAALERLDRGAGGSRTRSNQSRAAS